MPPGLIFGLVLAYMAVLFAIAWGADRGAAPAGRTSGPWVYALSLAVYCTSWTYFGAVGTASRSGWEFLPIYLGPTLTLLVCFPLWRRVLSAAKRENAGSIADFLSARYGKSRALGALVTVVAIVGSLPYIALQLKSLGMTYQELAGRDAAGSGETVLLIAMALAAFAVLFGARRADLTEHNRGLVRAVAFESLVKLAALLTAAGFAAWLLSRVGPPGAPLAAMVIVEAVALSAMASNALILPLIFRRTGVDAREGADVRGLILQVRRIAIAVILLLAYLYYRALAPESDLASIGLTAFAAAAQFCPALVGAVFWRGGHRLGAIAGVSAGSLLWLYTLALPQLLGAEAMRAALPGLLDPRALFGLDGLDPLTHGVVWSVGVNAALFVGVSLRARRRLVDRVQAAAFIDQEARPEPRGRALQATVADLRTLAARFLGPAAAARVFDAIARERGAAIADHHRVDGELTHAVERALAGVMGASSARGAVAAALSGAALPVEAVVRMLDETAQEHQFNRDLLLSALENISQGVSVVDADLRLVAWNSSYLDLFDFPPGFLHVGMPIADVIRYNALRGECGPGEVDAHVAKRLEHMQRGARHTYERVRDNGVVLKTHGAPLPGGGYVTSFTDFTEDRRREYALEARVEARTRELSEAKSLAERAVESKTRFLAAASHDLLQPLNAARLFVAALAEDLRDEASDAYSLALNADRAIDAADRLLRALLNLSKLEAGGVQPEVRSFPAQPLLTELCEDFAPLALEGGLSLASAPTTLWVRSDRDLLWSILQNLVANALRYTETGRVRIGCRRSPAGVRFEVWDTGPGIPAESLQSIFQPFTRLHGRRTADRGMGLGLAIVERVASLLAHPVSVRSRPGSGSVFSVTVPRTRAPKASAAPAPRPRATGLDGLVVLCVDNEPAILESLAALLSRWGVRPRLARTLAEAREAGDGVDVVLADYRLDDGETGLQVIDALSRQAKRFALVTADADPALMEAARVRGAAVLRKPVEPAALRAFLSRPELLAAE